MEKNNCLPLSIRSHFSDRNNIEKIPEEIQLEELDERTRVGIFNLWSEIYYEFSSAIGNSYDILHSFLRNMMIDLYNQPIVKGRLLDVHKFLEIIFNTILNDDYNKVFDLLEYSVKRIQEHKNEFGGRSISPNNNLQLRFNKLFEKEIVGYRFINYQITKISDSIEVDSINESFNNPIDVVKNHIAKAAKFLSNRENPDYQNSIKESITALESLAQIIINSKGAEATLGKMLKKLEDDGMINSAMKAGFSALYGFASEGQGVRHGSVNGQAVTFEDAKYILVISTAFINFVIGKQAVK